jgi:hypothetical protein
MSGTWDGFSARLGPPPRSTKGEGPACTGFRIGQVEASLLARSTEADESVSSNHNIAAHQHASSTARERRRIAGRIEPQYQGYEAENYNSFFKIQVIIGPLNRRWLHKGV